MRRPSRRSLLRTLVLAVGAAHAGCGALLAASDDPSSAPDRDASVPDGPITAEGGSDGKIDEASVGPHLRVFLTSKEFTLDEIGANLDALCESQLPPSLAGARFVPWLSTSARSARDAIKGNGPWRTMTGEMVAANREALFGGKLESPINVDERGVRLAGAKNVWTGTTIAGDVAENCNDWQTPNRNVLIGSVVQTDARWTALSNAPTCANALTAVYCFESE